MVGVNSYIHRLGTVAIFATLFAAIQVNGEKGCVFDYEHASEFELECNGAKGSWNVNEAVKESPNKKVLILASGQEGCLKIKRPISLNSTYPVALRFYQDAEKDATGKITLRLIPKEGSCVDEECVWNVASEPDFKPREWVTVEHKFPLKSLKEYYVQLEVENAKGKFLLDRVTLPTADPSRCHEVAVKDMKDETRINLPDPLVGVSGNGTGGGGGGGSGGGSGGGGSGGGAASDCNLVELSKNLMLTSASVLTLNNLFN